MRQFEQRVTGELVAADFIHRSGEFRAKDTGKLVDFKLLPCGTVTYAGAGADLRDVPLGTTLQFSLYPGVGDVAAVAAVRDDFSLSTEAGEAYRLDEVHVASKTLSITKRPDNAHAELRVDDRTRFWKGDKLVTLRDLTPGDPLLVDFRGSQCADVWAGAEAQRLATTQQRKRHTDFLKERGLPAWVENVEGKRLTVTLFGEADDLRAMLKSEGIDPARWARERRHVRAVVANEDLRTYNPPVDGQGSTVVEYKTVDTDAYSSSGISWVIEPNLMLEGFRAGHVVRVFANPSWPVHDMPFGEGVYTEVPNAKVEEESPNQYPFRTDFGNEGLASYALKPGAFPPYGSQHTVGGELTKVDPGGRAGQFRTDRTGELVDFTLPPFGAVLYRHAEAELADVPLGTHCYFFVYQDPHGAFTRAALVTDDFTRTVDDRVTYRLEAVNLAEGKLALARQLPPTKDEHDHLVKPPDLGHGEFLVDDKTRVWRGDAPATLGDLAVGDELLVNVSGRTATGDGRCTEIWLGAETIKKATEQQRAKYGAALKEQGLAGWVDRVEGREVTVTLFAADRAEFAKAVEGDRWGKGVTVVTVDEGLRAGNTSPVSMTFKRRLPDVNTVGDYGCSGIHLVLESPEGQPVCGAGQIVRLWKDGWPVTIRRE